jgi:class 3 adenylate cyclase
MSAAATRTWNWRFEQPPAAVWPLLSDTVRFNEAAGTLTYALEQTPRPDGTVRRVARAKAGPIKLEWEEYPADWVANRGFTLKRVFRNGPLKQFAATLELTAAGDGTNVRYSITGEPRNPLGWLALHVGVFRVTGRKFEAMIAAAKSHAAGQRRAVFDFPPPRLPDGARQRVAAMVQRIDASPHGHGLAARLAAHVLDAPDADLQVIRPLALARDWNVEPRLAIELCLEASRAGLLAMTWDVLCPACRGAGGAAANLDQMPKGVHCASCNVSYDANFAKNVEVAFRPAAAVRVLPAGAYCLSGPQSTPHVLVQQTLAAGEAREVRADLAPGDYRLRTLTSGEPVDVTFSGGGFPAVVATAGQVTAGAPAAPGMVRLENRRGHALTLVVESRDWLKDALTAHRATALQAFRDLYPEQVLRPGEDLAVDTVALMFTDLKGSTALYERIGDSAAYRLVRAHFAFLVDQVRRHEGALVKTIGDAVMAAFSDPGQAVAAALAVQQNVARFNAEQGGEEIVIKMGVHAGPCIVVNLNDRLDYFGSTVNLAARLQGMSEGGDAVISHAAAGDPGAAKHLAGYGWQDEAANLKGFAAPVPFRRYLHQDLLNPLAAIGAATG